MADATIDDFLARVMERLPDMSRDKFTSQSWRYEGRPTGEGLGLKPGVDVDPEAVISRILDVAAYPGNVKYVDATIVAKQVAYALSAAPLKKDVGSLKYALMTKGADATTGTVLAANIDSMIAWSQRA